MRPARALRRFWCVVAASFRRAPRHRPRWRLLLAGWRYGQQRLVGGERVRLFVGIRELHSPGLLFAGVDLEETCAIIPARQAILGAAHGEFLVARTHECLTRPFATAVIVNRVDVIESGDQRSTQQRLARPGCKVPPAFSGPPILVLVADGNADPAGG